MKNGIWVVLVMINVILGFEECPTLIMDDKVYDLGSMKSRDNIAYILNNAVIEISMCEPIDCGQSRAYVAKIQNSICYPYTSSYSPLQNRYSYIEDNNPKKGIKIQYYPFPPTNESQLRNATLMLYCNEQLANKTKCEQSKANEINCQIFDSAGCPSLHINSFWTFLIDHKLVFAIIIWIVSLVLLFVGYIAIRVTLFMYGIFTGSCCSVIFIAENYQNFVLQSSSLFIFIICLSVLLGIAFGIVLLTLPRLGYFNIGIWVSITISLLLQNAVFFLTGSLLAFYITFGVLALVIGIISLLKFRMYVIISSAFVSSFWIIRPLGFFLPDYPNQFLSGGNFLISKSTPWQFYLYLVSILILSILGIVFQICISNKLKGKKGRYYLQDDDPLREKLGRILEFGQIKQMLKAGKEEIVFLKNIVVDSDEEQEERQQEEGLQIQMVQINQKARKSE